MERALLFRIEWMKFQMSQMASKKGISDPEVLLLSQEIDLLLNQYQKIEDGPTLPSDRKRLTMKESIGFNYIDAVV